MIVVQDLHKRYGDFEAIRGLSFHVRHGEVFGFLGPNGAGKSTTMRIIAGLIQATAGQVRVDGHDLRREPLRAKAITSFIPDRPFLYEKLTAFEMLELQGGLHGLARAEIAARGEALLRRFELHEWSDGLIESFSHGMKQRLVFATALLPRPRLLIVDEPMVGLDPRGARLVKAVLREQCEAGASVFLSTHTMEVAQEICDRIAILSRGTIAALGTMDELRAQAEEPGSSLEQIFLRLTEEAQQQPDPRHGAAEEPSK
ncbi:ABC transporter ATP-binding protein [Paraliomyxa miuraensis]|uniref:ABC transporter ATP-binding protein n=1 Tax=Paraliomyxa miuraensis TaxID=376150 RepID=UPI002259EEED|nr:ABC transporter ATP-binding protein [Paraliomyxa miuraensis]MCX4243561.1 ABC transporter ATP-binding protein [Paraliomyxa miuraensis]